MRVVCAVTSVNPASPAFVELVDQSGQSMPLCPKVWVLTKHAHTRGLSTCLSA